MARIKIRSYIKIRDLENEERDSQMGILRDVDWKWVDSYLHTEDIKNIYQYSPTTAMITYYGDISPTLVKGTIDEIESFILTAEYQEYLIYNKKFDVQEVDEDTEIV